MRAFADYQGRVNPDPIEPDTSYFEFTYGDAAFFFLDTRRFRSPAAKTMLGDTQKHHLLAWLTRTNHTASFKFIISSMPFTRNFEQGSMDSWVDYLDERDTL